MSDLSIFVPLTKVDEEKRLVFGIATAEYPDRSGEICDYATTKPYYEKWSADFRKASGGKSMGNIRAMHGKIAVGKTVNIEFDDDKRQIEICAKIVDDNEWKKVLEGVYTGFSQGGSYVNRWDDPDDATLKRYTANPTEISLVDIPCLPTATFEYIKSDGAHEMRKFATVDTDLSDEDFEKALDLLTEALWMTSGATGEQAADVVAQAMAKYSDDESRDASGRWTSGGGSSSSKRDGSTKLGRAIVGAAGGATGALPGAAVEALLGAPQAAAATLAISAAAGAYAGSKARTKQAAEAAGSDAGKKVGAFIGGVKTVRSVAPIIAGSVGRAAAAGAKTAASATRSWRNSRQGYAGKYDAKSGSFNSTVEATAKLADVINELEKMGISMTDKKLTNDQVAKRAGELAKAAGDETKWPEFIEAARADLEKVAEVSVEVTLEKVAEVTAEVTLEKTTEEVSLEKAAADASAAAATQDAPAVAQVSEEDGPKQVWLAKDGSHHVKKAEALAKNVEIDAAAAAGALVDPIEKLFADIRKSASGEDVIVVSSYDEMKKYLGEEVYDAQRAIEALGTIFSLMRNEISENEKSPEQIASLHDAANRLKDFIIAEINEDNSGPDDVSAMTPMEMAAKMGDLAKAGARNSAADKEHLAAIHDHCVSLGHECAGAEKSAETGDLAKAVSENALLKKTVDEFVPKLEEVMTLVKAQATKIATLEAQPVAPPTLRLVEKGGDVMFSQGGSTNDELTKMFEALPQEQKAEMLVKLSQQNPMRTMGK